MTADDELKCTNPACTCPLGDDEDFCCLACRDSKELTECPCGHEACGFDESEATAR